MKNNVVERLVSMAATSAAGSQNGDLATVECVREPGITKSFEADRDSRVVVLACESVDGNPRPLASGPMRPWDGMVDNAALATLKSYHGDGWAEGPC
eukprot:scaffold135471_cov31-Tisochrysis_lutea.AAC.4